MDTLTRLQAACDAIDRTEEELSFANIGQRCEADFRKGPRAQSIKNDPGMKEYVAARRDERLLAAEADPRKGWKPLNATTSQIERITDQSLRARMRNLHADWIETRKRLTDIQAALAVISPGVDIDTLIRRWNANPGASVSIEPLRPGQVLAPEDVEALRVLLVLFDDKERLARFTLVNDGRRIQRSKGVEEELVSHKVLAGLRRLHASMTERPTPAVIDLDSEAAD